MTLRVTVPGSGRFAKLWAASTASALGSGLVLVAAPLYVAAHTSNPLVVSATTGVSWLPWLLFALPGGVLVDRVPLARPAADAAHDGDPDRAAERHPHRDDLGAGPAGQGAAPPRRGRLRRGSG